MIPAGEALAAIGRLEGVLERFRDVAKARPNRRAAAWAEDHAGDQVADVSDRVRAEVHDLVVAALEEGWTKDELADELAELGFDEDRAWVIADQELRTARGGGKLTGWLEQVDAGKLTDRARKVWRANVDACPVCRQLHGQTQFLEEPFDSALGPVMHEPAHVS